MELSQGRTEPKWIVYKYIYTSLVNVLQSNGHFSKLQRNHQEAVIRFHIKNQIYKLKYT